MTWPEFKYIVDKKIEEMKLNPFDLYLYRIDVNMRVHDQIDIERDDRGDIVIESVD